MLRTIHAAILRWTPLLLTALLLSDVSPSAVVFAQPATAGSAPVQAASPAASEDEVTVACYYFGNYHPGDPRNVKAKGPAWSEWELVKAARPRFPGHHQPNVPLWGYADESDPQAMAQKIAAAAAHGIDAFIFDWYYYNDGPFLDRPIDRGFLQAENNAQLEFAFMWANHDWLDIHPYRRGAPRKVLYPGTVTPETFDKICTHVISRYFSHPSYWRIDGRPYFSFYDLTALLDSFGSVAATRAALDQFRAQAVAAGLPGLHLNAVVWGQPILPGERQPADAPQLVRDLGFDSVTSYVWIHHVPLPDLQTDYNVVRDAYFQYWSEAVEKFDVPYFPNVTMGWDSSPRADQRDEFGNFGYPFTNTISGNTPARFQEALALTKERLLAQPDGPRILNINCWNEWTEGSYLEPDEVHGMKYLEAVRNVCGPANATADATGQGGVRKLRLLPPAAGNPRNSEGDFVQLQDGRILFVYTHFTGGGDDNDAAYLAGRFSDDGGLTWTPDDVTIVPNEGAWNVMSVSLLRLQSGAIALFYLCKQADDDCRTFLRTSTDEGQTWSSATLCMPPRGYYVVNNDRVIQLANGRLVIPAAQHVRAGETQFRPGVPMCFVSDDEGKTWTRGAEIAPPPDSRSGLQEPGAIELKDGRLMMLCRTDRGCQYRCYSSDGGLTWTAAEPTDIQSPCSPATFERIPQTGDILMVWNDHSADPALGEKRTPLTVAVSRDEGQTWECVKNIEDDPAGWYCYTALEFVGDRVLLAYCATDASLPPLSRTSITCFDLDWLYDWQHIFNGRDLSGWEGDPRLWSVRDGALRGETTAENPAHGNTFLIWNGGVTGDFELRLSFRCNATNNSGIQYRSQRITEGQLPNAWVVRGYQHEIRNELTLPSVTGFLYDEGGQRGRMCLVGEKVIWNADGTKQVVETFLDQQAFTQLFKLDAWNDVVIVARGPRLPHYLNGQLVLDCTDNDPQRARREGVLALQLHAGAPMWAEYKDIRIRNLE